MVEQLLTKLEGHLEQGLAGNLSQEPDDLVDFEENIDVGLVVNFGVLDVELDLCQAVKENGRQALPIMAFDQGY